MTTCAEFGCTREPMRSSVGNAYRYCEACTHRLLSVAFGPKEPRSWHDRAKAGTLPAYAIGGIPSEPSGAPERHAPSPEALTLTGSPEVAQRVA